MRHLPDGFRKFAVIVCLLVVAGFELAGLKFRELGPRFRALPVFARMEPDVARAHGSGLAFDRRYGQFLDAIRLAVPATATVAIEAPITSGLYAYSAAYVLAPRRVVPFSRLAEADFAAAYGTARPPGAPVAAAIPFGSLGRLR